MPTPTIVHKLFINRTAFEIVNQANYHLSMRDLKQQQVSHVARFMLDNMDKIGTEALASLRALGPLHGNIRLWLRLPKPYAEKLDTLRERLEAETGKPLHARDAIILLAHTLPDFIA